MSQASRARQRKNGCENRAVAAALHHLTKVGFWVVKNKNKADPVSSQSIRNRSSQDDPANTTADQPAQVSQGLGDTQ